MVAEAVRRGDVYLINLNPTRGREIRKTRRCVVVSPDELNAHLRTFNVAPMTTGSRPYPFRARCRFAGKVGQVFWTNCARSIRNASSAALGGSERAR